MKLVTLYECKMSTLKAALDPKYLQEEDLYYIWIIIKSIKMIQNIVRILIKVNDHISPSLQLSPVSNR